MPTDDSSTSSATSGSGPTRTTTPTTTTTIVYANDLQGIQPPTFDWNSSELVQQFRSFRRYCELLLTTPTYANKPPESVVNYMLLWLGPKAVEIYDNWSHLTDVQKKDPSSVWDAFSQYFEPKSNFRLSRFQLRDMKQESKESVDSFVNRLKVQARKCNFKDINELEDNLIDQLIKGVVHVSVQKKLLDQDPKVLTLDKATDFARTFEATQSQLLQLGCTEQVNYVQKGTRPRGKSVFSHKQSQGDVTHKYSNSKCYFCGGQFHNRENCPAKDQKCNKCERIGHWGKMCMSSNCSAKYKSKGSKNNPGKFKGKGRKFHEVTSDFSENQSSQLSDNFESLDFDAIYLSIDSDLDHNDRSVAYATIRIEAYPGRFTNLKGKVDTGAQGNILPIRTFKNLYPGFVDSRGLPVNTKKSNVMLYAYNGTVIKQYGTIDLPCRHQEGIWTRTRFYVADTPGPVIFGLRTSQSLGLVKLNCEILTQAPSISGVQTINSLDSLMKFYPDRFQGLGKFPGEHRLLVDEKVEPKIHPPRRAPIQLQEKIKAELERMKSLDVIRPVDEPTEWVSSITYVHKPDGSLRICLDPKDLNVALKRGHHHTPTVEELTHRFAGAQFFSKLDAKSGYWSVPLDKDSQLLTAFNSPFGRFCFKRLPFGLKTSQDVFQRAMDKILDGLPGIVTIADDIVVYGKNVKEHDENLHRLMQRAQEKGLVFNSSKCKIKEESIPFFGHVYSRNGISPDSKKVQAINDLSVPTSVTEVQSFLGMITYLAPFIPNLSSHTSSLRQLLQKDSDFQWHSEHQVAFDTLKHLICSASSLSYFNPAKSAVVQVDASQNALGAALIQDNKPIAYASKSLTETESRYANIERELLACVFGAERFHTYLFGKHFTIQSDHRPLDMISKKNLTAAPARLQRMLLRLQKYDYEIQYKPGSEVILADSLSRLPKKMKEAEIGFDVAVCFVQFSTQRLAELREETRQDAVLSCLMKYIAQGFPDSRRDVHQQVRQFWPFRDELCIEDGLVLKGEQVVIPQTLQKEYLDKIHEGHQGVTRSQQRAKSSVYWPGIYKDIETLVTSCLLCQKHQPSQAKEPLEPIVPNIPNVPWHTIGSDLFTLDEKNYLIITDYYSKFPFIEELGNDSTSKKIAELTSKIFSIFGVPNTVITDNGPQFQGAAYQKMLQGYGVCHITSSPHHPQSHGFIERSIRTIKSLLKKSGEDSNKALLNFRTTPPGPHNLSPAELMFGRKVQANLPIRTHGFHDDHHIEKCTERQSASHDHYNENKRELPELSIDQPIFFQDVAKKTWSPGTVIGIGPEPRSYTIQCSTTRRNLRRNRILLKPQRIPFQDVNCSTSSSSMFKPDSDYSTNTRNPARASSTNELPSTSSTSSRDDNTPIAIARTPERVSNVIHPTNSSNVNVPISRSGRAIIAPKRLIEEV